MAKFDPFFGVVDDNFSAKKPQSNQSNKSSKRSNDDNGWQTTAIVVLAIIVSFFASTALGIIEIDNVAQSFANFIEYVQGLFNG